MALNREAIYKALLERLETIQGFVTVSRNWKVWDDVPASSQPALFLPHGNEVPVQARGLPPAWRLQPTLWIYCRTDQDPSEAPYTRLATLIQGVEAALERQPDEQGGFAKPDTYGTTLGGLVSHCWIGGPIVTDEGILGGQAVAQIPLDILATS
jgi:hypothetical protein